MVNAVNLRVGVTPLFSLPDDEDEALEMAEFLLAHGADAGLRNKSGITPDEAARKRELADAADLMQALRTGRKILGSTRGDHASRGRIP